LPINKHFTLLHSPLLLLLPEDKDIKNDLFSNIPASHTSCSASL
ncbi:6184_t:CDS:1, partial [Racocetra persica]